MCVQVHSLHSIYKPYIFRNKTDNSSIVLIYIYTLHVYIILKNLNSHHLSLTQHIAIHIILIHSFDIILSFSSSCRRTNYTVSLNNFNNTAVVYTYHRYLHHIFYILINLTDCYFVCFLNSSRRTVGERERNKTKQSRSKRPYICNNVFFLISLSRSCII